MIVKKVELTNLQITLEIWKDTQRKFLNVLTTFSVKGKISNKKTYFHSIFNNEEFFLKNIF